MPTDNIKEIMDGDIFMQDQEGSIKKIAEIIQFENGVTDEKDDAIDAMKYAVEQQKEGTITMTISRESSKHLQKMIGIQKITRKRFIKLLMGCRIQRNDAEKFADVIHKTELGYSPIMVQAVVEWIIKELNKKEVGD